MRIARLAACLPALLFVPTACDEDTGSGQRKCYESAQVYALDPAGAACGRRQSISLQYCERIPEETCKSKETNVTCIGTPGDVGLLIELSPCAKVDSLPESWGLADEFQTGANAARGCAEIRNLCDGGTLPYTPPEGVVPSGGGAGTSGTAGAAGATAGSAGKSASGSGGATAGSAGSAGTSASGGATAGSAGKSASGSGGATAGSAGKSGSGASAGSAGKSASGSGGASAGNGGASG